MGKVDFNIYSSDIIDRQVLTTLLHNDPSMRMALGHTNTYESTFVTPPDVGNTARISIISYGDDFDLLTLPPCMPPIIAQRLGGAIRSVYNINGWSQDEDDLDSEWTIWAILQVFATHWPMVFDDNHHTCLYTNKDVLEDTIEESFPLSDTVTFTPADDALMQVAEIPEPLQMQMHTWKSTKILDSKQMQDAALGGINHLIHLRGQPEYGAYRQILLRVLGEDPPQSMALSAVADILRYEVVQDVSGKMMLVETPSLLYLEYSEHPETVHDITDMLIERYRHWRALTTKRLILCENSPRAQEVHAEILLGSLEGDIVTPYIACAYYAFHFFDAVS